MTTVLWWAFPALTTARGIYWKQGQLAFLEALATRSQITG